MSISREIDPYLVGEPSGWDDEFLTAADLDDELDWELDWELEGPHVQASFWPDYMAKASFYGPTPDPNNPHQHLLIEADGLAAEICVHCLQAWPCTSSGIRPPGAQLYTFPTREEWLERSKINPNAHPRPLWRELGRKGSGAWEYVGRPK
jgi:hypothetical protein